MGDEKWEIRPGETVINRVTAALNGLNNIGTLYLTSERLLWRAQRFRPLLTIAWGASELSLALGDIEDCRARSFVLFVKAGDAKYQFSLFRWWFPVLLWWKLTRRWAAAINQARGRASLQRPRLDQAP
ncbi:MAG: hypothetical protein E6J43_08315 [Chloroflexi bacterium]|nr:MAG: hypothetical protein E6J43_08315 [Chloroflexota bacterium]